MGKLLKKFYSMYIIVYTLVFSTLIFLIMGEPSFLINVFSMFVTCVSLLITDKIAKKFFVEFKSNK